MKTPINYLPSYERYLFAIFGTDVVRLTPTERRKLGDYCHELHNGPKPEHCILWTCCDVAREVSRRAGVGGLRAFIANLSYEENGGLHGVS